IFRPGVCEISPDRPQAAASPSPSGRASYKGQCNSVPSPLEGEHLCCESSMLRGPKPVFFEQGIGHDDKLSHDSGKGELGLFSAADQAFVEGVELWIAAAGGESGPVERASRTGSSAADMAKTG